MRSCLVEVGHIRLEDAVQLPLMQDQQVIEAFLPHTPQEALTDGIGSRCMNRRFEQLDATGRRHASEARPKFGIVIMYQILGCVPIGGGFPELLRHPGISRRSSDAYVDHLARMQFDDEEGKEGSKEQIGDLQEVTRPDLCDVGVHKGCPPLTSWLLCANVSHIFLDRALADMKAQLQQFPANPFSSPEPIVLRHLSDQGDRFRGNLWLVRRGL